MVLYAWKESFRTGIAHIDEQHRQFFYLLNELDQAIRFRREDDVLEPLFRELDRYVRVHFSDEEKLMEGIAYPDLPRQRREHEYFATQLGLLRSRHDNHDARIGSAALDFMSEWFMNHVINEDKQLGEFLFSNRPPVP
jgi:hemerythrin